MIFDEISVQGMFLAPAPSRDDPLAQRSYLAIKIAGGLSVEATDVESAVTILRDEVAKRCEEALRGALAAPGTSVAAMKSS